MQYTLNPSVSHRGSLVLSQAQTLWNRTLNPTKSTKKVLWRGKDRKKTQNPNP